MWLALVVIFGVLWTRSRQTVPKPESKRDSSGAVRRVRQGFAALVGNTKMVRLASLSALTSCEILAKAEYENPGGTSKDRIARQIVEDAEDAGLLGPGGTIVEGSSGSTGISLALMAACRGYKCKIFMPDDQAMEKTVLLQTLGADVERVKPVSIVHPRHYVNLARTFAESTPGAFFADQFESPSNAAAHAATTGPEVWHQTDGLVDAFVMGSGTGGTLAGVSKYLKAMKPSAKVFLVDPPGSSLFHKVKHGVCYSEQQAEARVKRHRYDTIIEGVGLDRLTANFSAAVIDDAFRCTDQEAVHMSRWLLRHEGIFVGSSSAMHCVGAVKAAMLLGPGHTIVTLLCDSGQRHVSRLWNPEFLASRETPDSKLSVDNTPSWGEHEAHPDHHLSYVATIERTAQAQADIPERSSRLSMFSVANPLGSGDLRQPLSRGASRKAATLIGARRRTVGAANSAQGDAVRLAVDAPSSRVLIDFSFSRFIITFFLNLFDPLSLPVVLALYGRAAARNMSLLRPSLSITWLVTLLPMYVIIATSILGFHPEEDGVFVTEFVLFVAFFVSRHFVIALKYAFMPNCDFNTILSGDAEAANAIQTRHQLLTGWVEPSEDVVFIEFLDSAARNRVDPNVFAFTIPNKPSVWTLLSTLTGIDESALIDDLVPTSNPETVSIPCQRLGMWLLSKPVSKKWAFKQKLLIAAIIALSILQSLLPIIELVRLHPVVIVKEVVDRILAMASRFLLFWYSMMYMYTAAVDYHRRYTNAKLLTRLITHVPLKNGPSDPLQWNAPIVDVAMPKNAHAFYALRTIVHDLGRRYNLRIQFIAMYFFVVAAVFVVLAIDTIISRKSNGPAFLHAEEANILTTFTLVMVVVTWSLAFIMLVFAVLANDQSIEATHSMLKRELMLRQRHEDELPEQAYSSYILAAKTLASIQKLLKSDMLLSPNRVLGFPATWSLLKGVVAATTSAIIIFVGLILSPSH